MRTTMTTLQRLEWNADGDSRDEIVQRVLSGAAHACNDNYRGVNGVRHN